MIDLLDSNIIGKIRARVRLRNFMKRSRVYLAAVFFLLCCVLMTGCFQASNDDDAFRTVPVTNNPNNLGSKPSSPGIPY